MASSRVFRGCRVLMAAARFKASAAGGGGTVKATTTTKMGRPNSNGILKEVPVSPQLANFVGVPQLSRTDAVKKVWDYIKLHNLQNPTNKKEIHCDEKLKTIFDGKDKVGFLEIAKLLSNHFVKTN